MQTKRSRSLDSAKPQASGMSGFIVPSMEARIRPRRPRWIDVPHRCMRGVLSLTGTLPKAVEAQKD
jgi:hypothetical protein